MTVVKRTLAWLMWGILSEIIPLALLFVFACVEAEELVLPRDVYGYLTVILVPFGIFLVVNGDLITDGFFQRLTPFVMGFGGIFVLCATLLIAIAAVFQAKASASFVGERMYWYLEIGLSVVLLFSASLVKSYIEVNRVKKN